MHCPKLGMMVVIFLCFTLVAAAPADLKPVVSRKPSPDLALSDSKGVVVKISNLKGRVVLLDFWATWCGGCKVEIPWYMEFQERYKERGLSVVGVALDEEGWKTVQPFIEEKRVKYPVVIGTFDLAKPFGVEALPVTLLLDRSGRIADLRAGMVDKVVFQKEIEALLEEGSAAKR